MGKLKKGFALLLVLTLTITLFATVHTNAKVKTKLNKKKVTIYVGQKIKLKVKNKKVKTKTKWKSTNKKVATVTKKGKVTAKKQGKATIVAKIGKKKYKCKVTVKTRSAVTQQVTQNPERTTAKQPVVTQPATEQSQLTTTNKTVTTQPVTQTTKQTTTQPVTQTQKQTTTQPATTKFETDATLEKPIGLTYAGNADLPYYFAWQSVNGADSYNVYVNGVYVQNVNVTAVNLDDSVFTRGSGEYTIGVSAVYGNKLSEATTVQYTYLGTGGSTTQAVITTKSETQSATQEKQTTTQSTQPATTKTPIVFTTDTTIEKPFGMKVESPEDGMVSVVWGRGTVDCYNVYVDGELRRTGVSAAKYTLPVYFEGTHTVAVATVVGTRESEKLEMSITVVGVGERETEAETCPEELKPQLRSDLSISDDKVLIQLNNKTNGKYSDSQIYWCIIGYNSQNQLCYLDANGNMVPASVSLNTMTVNNRDVANVSHTLAEADYVYAPTIISGRMYLSYEKPIYIRFNNAADGTVGYEGVDLNNDTDPNADTLFEFAEFTIDGKYYWGNTTRVDFFSFPMITRLIGHTQYETYDKVVGDIGTREEIISSFVQNAPEAFKTLVNDKRIMAPCKSTFNEGKEYGNYFDSYIDEFWTKFANEDLVFSCESGAFTGRVEGNRIKFTKTGDSNVYYVYKPTTQEVLEGKGVFNQGNTVEKAIEAQLCAAFNRGVALEPSKWYKASEYYKNSINNYYAGFFHENSVVGLAYGFCYDDVNDQSTLLQYGNADALVIDLRW